MVSIQELLEILSNPLMPSTPKSYAEALLTILLYKSLEEEGYSMQDNKLQPNKNESTTV